MQSTADDPPWPQDAVEVAFVAGAWGIKGWIKVQPHASDPQALFGTRRWFAASPEGGTGMSRTTAPAGVATVPGLPRCLRIVQSREHGDGIVAQVQGVDDRAAAEALRGTRLFVSRQSFPTADADEYYWVDLIGLVVVDREGALLGRVTGLIETGPHSVLRVAAAPPGDEAAMVPAATPDEEKLIPFVSAYVDSVDLSARRIVVDWGSDY